MQGFDRATAQDTLGREKFVQQICDSLIRNNGSAKLVATELVVGLSGDWGSGKSSILKAVEASMEKNKSIKVFSFAPWMISDTHNLIQVFLVGLTKATGAEAGKIKEHFSKIGQFIAGPVNAVVPGSKNIIDALDDFFLKEDLGETYKKYQNFFESSENKVLVIIDELDRLMDDEIITLFRMIKAIGDLPNVSYLLAYDKKRVAQALSLNKAPNGGEAYLEKIVQLEFQIPYLQPSRANRFLEDEIKNVSLGDIDPVSAENEERFRYFLPLVIPQFLKTPRDIKRVVNIWFGKWVNLREEVNWLDLLGFCVLECKSPGYVEAIRDDPFVITKDGYTSAHTSARGTNQLNMGEDRSWDHFFGSEEPAKEPINIHQVDTRNLARFLFPKYFQSGEFAPKSPSLAIENAHTLLAVLTYGEPDQLFLMEELNLFVGSDLESQKLRLEQWYQQSELDNFFSRLFGAYSDLDIKDENVFWRQIIFTIEGLNREGGRTENLRIFDRIELGLFNLCHTKVARGLHVQRLFSECIADGSLELISLALFREGTALDEGSERPVSRPKGFDDLMCRYRLKFMDKYCSQNTRSMQDLASSYPLVCFAHWPEFSANNKTKNEILRSSLRNHSSVEWVMQVLFRDNQRVGRDIVESIFDVAWLTKHLRNQRDNYGFGGETLNVHGYEVPRNKAMREAARICFPELYQELSNK